MNRVERRGRGMDAGSLRSSWGIAIGGLLGIVAIAACTTEPAPPPKAPVVPVPLTTAAATAEPEGAARPSGNEAALAKILARMSAVRGLSVLSKVELRTLDRATIESMIRAKAARELPSDVLDHETEAMVALGLVPPSYDATNGMFEMIGASIAGFYEPEDKTMYLASDLGEAERDETLAHELVHALQDQHFDLGPLFKYRADADEPLAAGHALAEGDATSAMFDHARGEAGFVEEDGFADAARDSIAKLSPDTPAALRESLLSPYIDGLAFVQALRRRGGFGAVDAAWRALPVTTEQILHLDKYDAREPAIEIAPASFEGLAKAKSDRRFSQVFTQVLGEQGLRIVLEAWADRDKAERAAAGWGGDRFVLAKGEGSAAGEVVLAWHLRFDTEEDAKEMEKILSAEAHGDCVSRPDVGPFAWARRKADVALALGPYSRKGKSVKGTGTCKEAKWWLQTILSPKPATQASKKP